MHKFKTKRTSGDPIQWSAWGKTAADALAQWGHCFGPGFEIVDADPALVEQG